MTTILLRTIIVYVILMTAMRLMGKRQIGELEVADLVTTLLISEIASLPITDNTLPLSHAVIPIAILISFEICSSALTVRFPKFKKLITARPSTLIVNGRMQRKAMFEARISNDELMTELRQNGYIDINDVSFAILEKSGKITVIPKPRAATPTCEQLQIKTKDTGIFHIIIDNGAANKFGMSQVGLSKAQLSHKLSKQGRRISDVFLMLVNDAGEERIIFKEDAE